MSGLKLELGEISNINKAQAVFNAQKTIEKEEVKKGQTKLPPIELNKKLMMMEGNVNRDNDFFKDQSSRG